ERELVLIVIAGEDLKTIIGPQAGLSASQLRSRHSIADDQFQVVLVGKDTGVKLRSENPVAARDLFALIDAMPMRRREMLRSKTKP
ncbi:MAG: DUF4174 domain-containing protein, partial [Rhizobiales bacterium]|nr:DUF4174 domain-containing protein [Hyphomicrobiales bacterium]